MRVQMMDPDPLWQWILQLGQWILQLGPWILQLGLWILQLGPWILPLWSKYNFFLVFMVPVKYSFVDLFYTKTIKSHNFDFNFYFQFWRFQIFFGFFLLLRRTILTFLIIWYHYWIKNSKSNKYCQCYQSYCKSPNPDTDFLPIHDPGVQKCFGSRRSGSATLMALSISSLNYPTW